MTAKREEKDCVRLSDVGECLNARVTSAWMCRGYASLRHGNHAQMSTQMWN